MNKEAVDVESDIDRLNTMRKRLKFRSWHRGTREMDLLLGNFADTYLEQFNREELLQYEDLLTHNDPDLYKWYTKKDRPKPDDQNEVMEKFLEFVLAEHK